MRAKVKGLARPCHGPRPRKSAALAQPCGGQKASPIETAHRFGRARWTKIKQCAPTREPQAVVHAKHQQPALATPVHEECAGAAQHRSCAEPAHARPKTGQPHRSRLASGFEAVAHSARAQGGVAR